MQKNKVAVITGASRGIGREIALLFAKNQIEPVLIGRDKQALHATRRCIEEFSGKAILMTGDLSDAVSIKKLTHQITSQFEHIDIIVNAAGVYHDNEKAFSNIDFDKYTSGEIYSIHTVGLIAPMMLCHDLIPYMKKYGKIINISGTFESGAKGWLPYYVSKKGLEDFTIGLSQELRSHSIQVNCISPSDTLTESYRRFFPQYANEELCILPEDIAKLALYLSSHNADKLTGQILVVK